MIKEIDKYKKFRHLLEVWEHKCVLCGESFDEIDSITREHLIPRSFMLKVLKKKNSTENNLAPSHFNCNSLRATLSLVETMKILNDRKKRWGIKLFRQWANKKVPNRWNTAPKVKKITKSQKRKIKKQLRKMGYETLTEKDIIE